MAVISFQEKRIVEDFLDMNFGYVLNFSDRTFQLFIADVTGIDIGLEKYFVNGGSKANRLRTFMRLESDYTIGKLFSEAYNIKLSDCQRKGDQFNEALGNDFLKITERLKSSTPVEALAALQANNDDKDFNLLAKIIKDSIDKNEPEAALDRLHTFVFKFIRELCNSHSIDYTKDESLNAIFGKYVKFLLANKSIDSEMSEKILRFSIQVIQAFNDIRNNKSLAHDNPVLNYHESILIFNNVSSTIRFIQFIEENKLGKLKHPIPESNESDI